jgi:hypothetical protein
MDQVLQFPEIVGRADDFERVLPPDDLFQGTPIDRGQNRGRRPNTR